MCHQQSRFAESQAVVASSGSSSNVHREMRGGTVGDSERGVWANEVITNLAAKALNRTRRLQIWSLPLFPTAKRQQ